MENTTEERYFRPNGKTLTNILDIEADKKLRRKDIVRNAQLGRINDAGRYIVPPAITKELLFMTKYVYQEDYEDILRESKAVFEFKPRGFLPVFGEVEFRLVVNDNLARLYLLENIYREFNGYQEINGVQISECACDKSKEDFIQDLLSLYNLKVVPKEDIDGKRPEDLVDDQEKISNIMFAKIYLNIISKNYLKTSASDEKDTFDTMVGILKEQGGEYGKRVLRHFIDRIEKRPDIMQIKEEEGYNEALNDILIGAMEVATTEDDMQDPNTESLYRKMYQVRYEKTDKHIEEAKENVKASVVEQVAERLTGARIIFHEEELESFADVIGNAPEASSKNNVSENVRETLESAMLKQKPQTQVPQEETKTAGQDQKDADAAKAPTEGAKKPEAKKGGESSGYDKVPGTDLWKHRAQTMGVYPSNKTKSTDKKQTAGGSGGETKKQETKTAGQETPVANPAEDKNPTSKKTDSPYARIANQVATEGVTHTKREFQETNLGEKDKRFEQYGSGARDIAQKNGKRVEDFYNGLKVNYNEEKSSSLFNQKGPIEGALNQNIDNMLVDSLTSSGKEVQTGNKEIEITRLKEIGKRNYEINETTLKNPNEETTTKAPSDQDQEQGQGQGL